MKKTTLLIDMDAIMADIYASWFPWYKKKTGEDIKLEDIKSYDVTKFVKKPEVLYKAFTTRGFFKSFPPLPGVVTYFQKLIEDERFEVIIVTQPPRDSSIAIKEKREWIKKYFPDFDLSNMIFCHKKYLIRGDVFFDDKPSHLVQWHEQNPKGILASINYPYNQVLNLKIVPEIYIFERETAWKEFYELLDAAF